MNASDKCELCKLPASFVMPFKTCANCYHKLTNRMIVYKSKLYIYIYTLGNSKKISLLICLSFIIIIGLIIATALLAIKANKLENESKYDCEDIKLDYETKLDELNHKFANLSRNYSSLNNSYANLSKEYNNLLINSQNLEENNSELRTNYSALSSKYYNLLISKFNNSNECPPILQDP